MVVRAAGARIASVPVDRDGLRVDRIPRDAKVICVTPSHQYPLGVRLSLARRTALLELARTRSAVVIEDDYDGEFRLEGQPLDSLKTLDHAQSVFYVGTFSKSLFPGLRLGFVIAPPWARHALVGAKQQSDWNAPPTTQEALSGFIAGGHLARHVRKMRRIYRERREILEGALRRFCGDKLEVAGIGVGLHLAAYLHAPIAPSEVIDRARREGIWLAAGQNFAIADPRVNWLVFGYGAIESRQIAEGVRRLGRLL